MTSFYGSEIMIVGDIMTTEPVCVRETDLMTQARQVMRDNHLHSLPVLDTNGRVTGMLDNRDILRLHSNRSDVTVGGYAHEFPLITPEMHRILTGVFNHGFNAGTMLIHEAYLPGTEIILRSSSSSPCYIGYTMARILLK